MWPQLELEMFALSIGFGFVSMQGSVILTAWSVRAEDRVSSAPNTLSHPPRTHSPCCWPVFRYRRLMTGCAMATPGRRLGPSTHFPCTSMGEWSIVPRG